MGWIDEVLQARGERASLGSMRLREMESDSSAALEVRVCSRYAARFLDSGLSA